MKAVIIPLGILTVLIVLVAAAGCGGNESILRSGKETPVPANTAAVKTAFEQDLAAMQTAGFKFVFVLRRRDGDKLDSADRGVIKLYTSQVNRRVATDDDRAFLVGSNYELPAKSIKELRDHLAFEDLSPAPAAALDNANANSNK